MNNETNPIHPDLVREEGETYPHFYARTYHTRMMEKFQHLAAKQGFVFVPDNEENIIFAFAHVIQSYADNEVRKQSQSLPTVEQPEKELDQLKKRCEAYRQQMYKLREELAILKGEPIDFDGKIVQSSQQDKDDKPIKITFGIQPEHFEVIERIRSKYNSSNLPESLQAKRVDMIYSEHLWNEVGKEIGWLPFTIALRYFYHQSKISQQPSQPEGKTLEGWISVSEQMPEIHTWVLVWIEERKMPFMAVWKDIGSGDQWYSPFLEIENQDIAYWMPLPLNSPPQK